MLKMGDRFGKGCKRRKIGKKNIIPKELEEIILFLKCLPK